MHLSDALPIRRNARLQTPVLRSMRWLRMQVAVLCLICLGQLGVAGRAAAEEMTLNIPDDQGAIRRVSGMLMLDYSRLTLSNGGAFDLMSLHYLLRANDWLYYGIGAFAPIAEGNYGGFFGADATLHAQRRMWGNWFVNAGVSVGVGAGGSSVTNIRTFSGQGLYGRAYAGVGYQARRFSFGVNVARIAILDSPINDTAVNLFVQTPLSLTTGSYADAGRRLGAEAYHAPQHENIVSLGATHMRQINPTGSYRGNIGLVALQFSHFHTENIYTFFSVDLGYSGLLWYNQAYGGIGRRFSLSPRLNLYGQLGLGSSGWVTDTVDTGSGFLIYPKVTMEYLWRNGLGATFSAGYMYAPFGTSRNWTVGLGLNYHLSYSNRERRESQGPLDYTMRGVRLNVFARRTSQIYYNGRNSDPLNMVAVQVDYALNERWYAAAQMAIAANAFRGFAGYAEAFIGLGYQRSLSRSGRFQGYAQLMVGGNDVGVSSSHEVGALIYPSLGVNYYINDRFSLYGQIGGTTSLGQYTGASPNNRWRNYSIGLGMSYRFSLPSRS
ncbi:hypothetical protein [Pararhodobacter oceanensis]|uniref:Uncharacterized protein n=1 Tax=Pararhodobacter oceanensis TaxID=2172121 RepID=A0A2T8HV55_9RHOB|nr:hypothetical protein [Pararhodobacter oceanensis]PVH29318.1 hypothetical protein DDE20_09940 [Pararhodobacter oceanensis]